MNEYEPMYIRLERVSYPVLNLGFVNSGLTPGQTGLSCLKCQLLCQCSAIMYLQTTMSFYHMNSLHLNKDQYN